MKKKRETEFQVCGKHSGKVVSRCESGMRVISCLTRVCVCVCVCVCVEGGWFS